MRFDLSGKPVVLGVARLQASFFVRYLVVKTGDLAVTIVNLDQWLLCRQQAFDVGREVMQRLPTGENDFREQANASLFVATEVSQGLEQLAEGADRLAVLMAAFVDDVQSSAMQALLDL